MEICLSAFLGEMATRSINFLISKCFKPTALELENRLRRVLLRARVIVDEAMQRHITNQAMLQQLDMLKEAMHRGHYILDTLRYRSHDKEYVEDQTVSHSSVLTKVNYVKDLCFSTRTSTQILGEMQEVLDSLSSLIIESKELVLFLMSYPCMYREPYGMHLLLSKYMFGRQTEKELVIKFLLHSQPHATEELEVLPIVGPGRVGKSTLVAHVCNDQRVRDHFSEIMLLRDFRDEKLTTLREGFAEDQENCTSRKDKRMLVVIEAVGDLDEGEWSRLYSASKVWLKSGSKIIITSRSDKISNLGTTQVLTLKYFSHEAYWYFFKTLTFGSTDPEMHPRLAYLAMEIARELNGSIISANITASFLRDNFDFHFWRVVLALLRGFIQRHVSRFGEHPSDVLDQNRPAYLEIVGRTFKEVVMLCHQYQSSSPEVVPKIRIQDVTYGSARPPGRFQALGWRSQIPPYYNYVYICEIRHLETTASKRKRSMRNGVTLP
ncbi:hypothetical protein ACP4OV_012075 [Aristida adscensionis]